MYTIIRCHYFPLQLDIYAKYVDQSNVVREITSARAICSGDLESEYYSGRMKELFFIIICVTISIPLIISVVLLIVFRKLHMVIGKSIEEPSNQANVVSLALIGINLSTAIFIFDVLACQVVSTSSHEYADNIDSYSINLQITYVTLFLDSLFLLSLVLCLIYIFYHNIKQFLGIQNRTSKIYNCILISISLIVGKDNVTQFKSITDCEVIAAIFPFMLIPPLLSVSTHIGYIVLAFLTEPSKCTTILIDCYAIFLYLYIAYKYCYKYHSSFNLSVRRDVCDKGDALENGGNNIEIEHLPQVLDRGAKYPVIYYEIETKNGYSQAANVQDRLCERAKINTQAFCLVLFYSLFIIGIMGMIISMFAVLPFASEDFLTYLINLFHVLALIVTTQFAFKIAFDAKFDVMNVIETFKDIITKKKVTEKNKDLVTTIKEEDSLAKVAGIVAAEITDVIVNKIPE